MAKEFNYKDYLKNNPLLNEDARTDAEEEGYKDGIKDEKEDLQKEDTRTDGKIKISELKTKIRERILGEMDASSWDRKDSPAGDSLELSPKKVGTSTVQEEEDVDIEDDVDIDIERDIDIDDKETESDIEIKTSVPGEDTDIEAVQGLLTKAQQEAEKLGDDKLMAQIGNTITYFTREHVVKV